MKKDEEKKEILQCKIPKVSILRDNNMPDFNELDLIRLPDADEILKQFKYSIDIPLIHLATQFVEAGREERSECKDPNHSIEVEKDNLKRQLEAPVLTQHAAFSRLMARFCQKVTQQDVEKFIPWINALIGKEKDLSPDERVILGLSYQLGLGCRADIQKAFQQFDKAKDHSAYAMTLLGGIYFNGLGIKKDFQKALECFEYAIQKKPIGWAYIQIGWIYENGNGVNKDNKAAFKFYQLAGELGDLYAENNLGQSYFGKKGVPRNLELAARYLALSAEHGLASAMNNYAARILTSPRDVKQKFHFYMMGAAAGSSAAFLDIGICYEDGKGVEKNIEIAAQYYRQAFVLGKNTDKSEFDRLYSMHKTNKVVCYYYAIIEKNVEVLADVMTDKRLFSQLWISDFYSDFVQVHKQSVNIAITLLPPNIKTQNFKGLSRVRANLAIHFFQQEEVAKACWYLKDLSKQHLLNAGSEDRLSPEENYQLGFWIFTHAINFFQELSCGLDPASKSFSLKSVLREAEYFLKLAAKKNHSDAQKLLLFVDQPDAVFNPHRLLTPVPVEIKKECKTSNDNDFNDFKHESKTMRVGK